MGSTKRSAWFGGTALVALVVIAAAWFLAISPTLSTAADTRAQAESTRQQNAILELKVAKLAADFKKLPDYKTQLATLQTQIPAEADLADYLRELNTIATGDSVTLTAISPSTPQTVLPVAAAASAAQPAATDTATPTGTSTDTSTTTSAPAATTTTTASGGLVAIPIALTVTGSYDHLLAFLDDLQNSTPRLFLVTALTVTAQQASPASGSNPAAATAAGDPVLTITGLTYVLPDTTATPTPAASSLPSSLPTAVPDKNPLIPYGGQ